MKQCTIEIFAANKLGQLLQTRDSVSDVPAGLIKVLSLPS